MLGRLDHAGFLAADLAATAERVGAQFGLEPARELELPQFSVSAVFLGAGSGNVEVFTFTDAALLAERLQGAELLLDHAAFEVCDLRAEMAAMAARGVRFSGPDRAAPVGSPFLLGGGLHVWTLPDTSSGCALQLIEPPPQP